MEKTATVVDNKIHIVFPYDMTLIQLVRGITGREWDGTNKVWTLPNTDWHKEQVIKVLEPVGFSVDQQIKQAITGKRTPRMEYPAGLFPYQKVGVDFILSANGRCIIADDMGLGKTIESLAYLKMFGGKTLIISPSSVIYKWGMECEKWSGMTSAVIPDGSSDMPDTDIHIMSYNIMVNRFEWLMGQPYDCIIFDEAHYLKNSKAQRTRIAKALVKAGVNKVLFLSGTPFLNHPLELFPILNMLDPVGFNNFYQYAVRYAGAQYIDGGWFFPPKATSNLRELSERLTKVMLRRTKREVATDLPELTRTIVPVEISNIAAYRKAVRDIKEWLDSKGKEVQNPKHVLTRLNVLRQITGEGKISAAVELAENVLQGDKQVVLFAHHKETVTSLEKALSSYGCLTIQGDTPVKKRSSNVNLFLMEDSPYRVMIITEAGAEGIDLYSASDIIFVEREWTPAKEEQAEGRLHRHGQKNAVQAWYLAASGTVDEKLAKIVEDKRKIIGDVIPQDEIITEILKSL